MKSVVEEGVRLVNSWSENEWFVWVGDDFSQPSYGFVVLFNQNRPTPLTREWADPWGIGTHGKRF